MTYIRPHIYTNKQISLIFNCVAPESVSLTRQLFIPLCINSLATWKQVVKGDYKKDCQTKKLRLILWIAIDGPELDSREFEDTIGLLKETSSRVAKLQFLYLYWSFFFFPYKISVRVIFFGGGGNLGGRGSNNDDSVYIIHELKNTASSWMGKVSSYSAERAIRNDG